MPNWCNNQLKIIGETEELVKFDKLFKSGSRACWFNENYQIVPHDRTPCYSFNNLRAIPWHIRFLGYSLAGYDWCCKNWDTKWDFETDSLYVQDFKSGYEEIYYEFDTPWSPPLELIRYISEKFPKLSFVISYYECGVWFGGENTYHNGELVEMIEYDDEEIRAYYGYDDEEETAC